VALKQAVFQPKFSPEMCEEARVRGFDDWLRTIDEAESASGKPMDSEDLAAILLTTFPADLKTTVEQGGEELMTNYEKLKAMSATYWVNRKKFTVGDDGGVKPMEIDAIKGKGKDGKGKDGKGGGGGKSGDLKCFGCGGPHFQRNCPLEKDKPKVKGKGKGKGKSKGGKGKGKGGGGRFVRAVEGTAYDENDESWTQDEAGAWWRWQDDDHEDDQEEEQAAAAAAVQVRPVMQPTYSAVQVHPVIQEENSDEESQDLWIYPIDVQEDFHHDVVSEYGDTEDSCPGLDSSSVEGDFEEVIVVVVMT